LKNNLNGKCDLLIIGSSMALNNVDSNELSLRFPGDAIINTASWGMSIEESELMLKKIILLCKPKTIILFTNYLDFTKTWGKEISWDRFERYLQGSYIESLYSRGFDLLYLVEDMKNLSIKTKDRRTYTSLAFDTTGTVNFDCNQFKIDPQRWDGYKFHLSPSNIRPDALNSISSIAEIANNTHSQLAVVTTPMRPVAEASLNPNVLAELWDSVKIRVENKNGIYIHMTGNDGFSDELFADFIHLNECGAKKLTENITTRIPGHS